MEMIIMEIIEKKVNIDLPYYSKNSIGFFKMDANKKCWIINVAFSYLGYTVDGNVFSDRNEESNEDEWEEAKKNMIELLKTI